MNARKTRPYLILAVLLLAALILSMAVGSVNIPLDKLFTLLFSGDTALTGEFRTFATILFKLRIPHAVLMMLVGASLGCSGAAYQGLFRNPLADPVPDRRGVGCRLGRHRCHVHPLAL